jgi:hypothetical protein
MSSASTVSSTYRSAGGLSLHTRVGLVLCLLTASLLGVLGACGCRARAARSTRRWRRPPGSPGNG